MNYEELRTAWKKQREQYQSWELRLINHARDLRKFFEDELALPNKTWNTYDTKEEKKYVELVDFYNKENPERKCINNTSINSDGSLVFGISITFDYMQDGFPKTNIFIPISIRFIDGKLEYGFYDMEAEADPGEWSQDKKTFYDNAIKRMYEYLSHDPHNGFGQKKRSIGFIN